MTGSTGLSALVLSVVLKRSARRATRVECYEIGLPIRNKF